MIVPTLARMLIREHTYKPIKGRVLTLGRQTIGLTYEQFLDLLKQENFFVSSQALQEVKIKHDDLTRAGKETDFISDDLFFGLLGIEKVNVMDVSDYEGADIIHDLNKPIPPSLEGQFDFIIDGGTFDHLIDLRMAFENVVKLLTPQGRVFQWNAASNFIGAAYMSLGPDLFYDYYTLNKFADCKVYVAAIDDMGQGELWDLYEFTENKGYGHFYSKQILLTIVMAEKGKESTYGNIPIQAQYRDSQLLQFYKERQRIMDLSGRKPYKESGRGANVRKPKTFVSKVKAFFGRVASHYREKGLPWIFRRCVKGKAVYIKHEVDGFRYIGKV